MKLDMSAAWNEAVATIKANFEVMAIIAGVFFFLPTLAAVFAITPMATVPQDATAEVMLQAMSDYFSTNALPLVLMTLAQAVGMIALLALLRDTGKPTVGEAIRAGFTGLLPYAAAQLIFGFGMALLSMVLIGLPSALGVQALAVVGMLAALIVLLYGAVKLSLTVPVVAIEKQTNPIAVLRRSWALTDGNSRRLLMFYLLLFVAYIVISLVVGLFFGLAFSLLGEGTAANIANGSLEGVLSAGASLVFAAVLAAVYRQFTRAG